jgi:multidrug resistance efflux pump
MATETMNFEAVETKAAPPESKPMTKWIVLGVLVVLAAVGVWYWLATAGHVSTDDAQVDGHIAPVAAKVYGNVLEVLVSDNQQVKKGDVLVRIDPRDAQAKVNLAKAALLYAQSQSSGADITVPLTRDVTVSSTSQADAQVQTAEAELARAGAEHRRAAGADISFARANVEASEATWERAKADLDRMRPLAEKAEISKLQFDSYSAAARVAESQLSAAKEKLSASLEDAETKKAAMAAAQARVSQAQAGVLQARANQKQIGRADGAGGFGGRCGGAGARGSGNGGVAAQLHGDRGAAGRHGDQEIGGARSDSAAGPESDGHRSVERHLGDGEFQGDAVARCARGPEGGGAVGYERAEISRSCRFDRRFHGSAHESVAAGERHGQFCESGAADSGEDCAGSPALRCDSAAGHECGRFHRDTVMAGLRISISRLRLAAFGADSSGAQVTNLPHFGSRGSDG